MNYSNDSSSGVTLVVSIIVLFGCFLFATCSNSCVDEDLKKVSPNAKADYLSHNTESWSDKLVGGNRMKKAVYATYQGIAKENGISVYDAIKNARGKFAGQFKNKFRSFGAFSSLPDVRNAYRIEDNGKICVVVHFTWTNCDSDNHCWTEHDEVIIPEIVQPKKYEYEPEDEYENQYVEPPMQKGVGIEYEGVDITIN